MRAVLDPNVIIAAALSPRASPGGVFRAWIEGAYDLIVSPLLLDELRRALAYPKLQHRISPHEADELVELLSRGAILTEDPQVAPPVSSTDPDDDYLIALAAETRSVLVSGDADLLELSPRIPVYSPAGALALLEDTT